MAHARARVGGGGARMLAPLIALAVVAMMCFFTILMALLGR
jgi:hypothetical protein